jgi:hypothetical protein
MAKKCIEKSFNRIDANKEVIFLDNNTISWISWSIKVELDVNTHFEDSDLGNQKKEAIDKVRKWTLKCIKWKYKVDDLTNLFSIKIDEGELTYKDKIIPLNGTILELSDTWVFESKNGKIAINKFQLSLKNRNIFFNKIIKEKWKRVIKNKHLFALIIASIIWWEWGSYLLSWKHNKYNEPIAQKWTMKTKSDQIRKDPILDVIEDINNQ